MRLRNKKTGDIYELHEFCLYDDKGFAKRPFLKSLSELNEEWEDAPEEPKGSALDLMILTLTNFIENEPDEDKVDLEDCKRMLDKLKAWKRLKDMGFKIEGIRYRNSENYIEWSIHPKGIDEHFDAEAFNEILHSLFGGEE